MYVRWKEWVESVAHLPRLIVFAYMAILAGYLRSSSQLYARCMLRGDIKPPKEPVATEASDVPEIAAEEEAAAAAAAVSSSGLGNRRPRRKVDVAALRKRETGTLTYVLELLASNLLKVLCVMIAVVSEPLAREHANHIVMLRSGAAACRLTYALLATGVWKWTVVAVFKTMQDLVALKRMSMDISMLPLRRAQIDEHESFRCVRQDILCSVYLMGPST